MDTATQNLEKITSGDAYDVIPGAVVFDEHDEFDKNGNLVRRFDRDALQRIVDRANELEATTGDLTLIGPGHTRDDVTNEEDQPPVWGFARNYRLGNFGPAQKLGILADLYVRKRIRTKDGQIVNGADYVKSFPRRSPEIWPEDMKLDWLALLRKAPQRNLGILTYSRTEQANELFNRGVLRHSRENHTPYFSARSEPVAAVGSDGKLRYSLENATMPDNMTTPVTPPNPNVNTQMAGDDIPPEGHEEFARHLDHAMRHHPALKYMADCYAASMATPTAGNVALPGSKKIGAEEDEEPERNERDSAGHGFEDDDDEERKAVMAAQQKRGTLVRSSRADANGNGKKAVDPEVLRYQKRVEELEAAHAEAKHNAKCARYEKVLNSLAHDEDITLDITEEMEHCSGLTDEQFDKHVARIRKNYSRSPVGLRTPPELIPSPDRSTDAQRMEKNADAVIRYCKANGITGEDSFRRGYAQMKEKNLLK